MASIESSPVCSLAISDALGSVFFPRIWLAARSACDVIFLADLRNREDVLNDHLLALDVIVTVLFQVTNLLLRCS